MTTKVKLSKANPEVKQLLTATYPDYNGRTVNLVCRDTYYMQDYWDGGTRYYVVAVDIATMRVVTPHRDATNPFKGDAHATINIPDGVALVEHIFFCGKDLGICVNVNSNTYPKMLPAGG